MTIPEDRPGFIRVPTARERWTKRGRVAKAWWLRIYDLARSWPYISIAVISAGVSLLAICLLTLGPPGVLARLIVSVWLGILTWQAVRAVRKWQSDTPIPLADEGGVTPAIPASSCLGDREDDMSSRHGEAATEFTLQSGVLERDEIVSYDERPHWGYAVAQLFKPQSLVAAAIVLLCLLTPWTTTGPVLPILKIVVLTGAMYWLGRQEADYWWKRYVVTNLYVRIISRPWAIFGGEYSLSLRLPRIETAGFERSMALRLLQLKAGGVSIDAAGDHDERFNSMSWVRRPDEFCRQLKPGTSDESSARAKGRWWRNRG